MADQPSDQHEEAVARMVFDALGVDAALGFTVRSGFVEGDRLPQGSLLERGSVFRD